MPVKTEYCIFLSMTYQVINKYSKLLLQEIY